MWPKWWADMAGKARVHYVDGRETTVGEMAEALGMKRQALYSLMCHRQCGLQTAVYLIRENLAMNGQGKAGRWMVDGRWMTIRQAAEMLGVERLRVYQWMRRHRQPDGTLAPLSEAVAAFREGRVKHGTGQPYVQHRVGRGTMTTIEAAERLGVSVCAVRLYMNRHKASLAATIRHYEKRKMQKAEKDILKILLGG